MGLVSGRFGNNVGPRTSTPPDNVVRFLVICI